MKSLLVGPTIHSFADFKSFADEFKIGEGDLVVTNEFIFDPHMKDLNLKANFMFQEKYGTGEPSDIMINAMIADFPKSGLKRVIAVGGGSVMDISKLLCFPVKNSLMEVYDKTITPFKRDKELICVPTTAGTGSEVTNIAVTYFSDLQTKKGIADDALLADQAIVIPDMLKGLPFKFFAPSAIDALIHATESYVNPLSNAFTEAFGVRAIELIIDGFKQIAEKGEDHRFQILEQFALGSIFAGIAFGNAGCGAVHAMSYPLGGKYHVSHGESNYVMFTEVFKTYVKKQPVGKIQKLNELFAGLLGCSVDVVYDKLEELLDKMLPKKKMREYGMQENEIEPFTDGVIAGQQRLLGNNYVPFERDDFINIYKALY